MELLRVFNNNVVLARNEDGAEVILTGRGIGFHVTTGSPVDESKIVKVFVPAGGRDPDHLGEQLAEIPPENIQMVLHAMREAGLADAQSPTLVVALADHLGFALRRAHTHTLVEYPLTAEVIHLYPDEYAKAETIRRVLSTSSGVELPDVETTAFALHLVNAGFASGDLSWTYTMTGVIQQILEVARSGLGIDLDPSSISAGRFITHLRYLFVRIRKDTQLEEHTLAVVRSIIDSYPREHDCALMIAQLLELRLGTPLSQEETAYLTLHLARLAGH